MKIILHPHYESLRSFVETIHQNFQQGKEIYKGRNSIRVFRVGDLELNVKQYCRPNIFNRFVYSFLRAPKGLRAYHYPQRIIEAGFETPMPVAYVELRRGGLIDVSYFISLQCPYSRRFYEFGNAELTPELCEISRAFARFTAGLHRADILHLDYSPGDVLFDRVNGEWRFSLVDTNRMYFGPVSLARGCANFARLWGQPQWFKLLAKEYALARGYDPAECEKHVMRARRRFWQRFQKRHQVLYDLKFE